MTTNVESSRKGHISDDLRIEEIAADSSALTKIIVQADQQPSPQGWGKLVGYFDPEHNRLFVKDSFALPMPKNDEKIKRSSIEDRLGFKYKKTGYKYRFVGFYIISDDKNIFNHNIIDYFLNAEEIKTPKLFLHFSTEKALLGKEPWSFYDLDDKINEATLSFVYKENYAYEMLHNEFDQMNVKTDNIFRTLPYSVTRSPIFEHYNAKYEGVYKNSFRGNKQVDYSDSLISQLGHNLEQTSITMNQLLVNKNKGKTTSKVNYLGDWVRHREIMGDKRELLNELSSKLSVLERLCG